MTARRAGAAAKAVALALAVAGTPAGLADRALAAPGDLVFESKGGDTAGAAYPPAHFRHWTHRIRYRCFACHPALFQMKQGADEMTMDKMRQGQFCGACHTGRVAFDIGFQSCSRCHAAPGQAPAETAPAVAPPEAPVETAPAEAPGQTPSQAPAQ